MAILNKLSTIFPGFQSGPEYYTLTAQNIPINAATPFVFNGFLNYIRAGKLRLKIYSAPAASQVTALLVTGTDGTTTYTFYQDATARTAATLLDFELDIISDLNLTSITVTVTTANAGTALTADLELAGGA